MIGWRRRCLLLVSIASLLGADAASARIENLDPFFPQSGSAGYDVSHYDVRLSYQPSSGRLKASATIEATASQTLSRLSLDLEGLRVSEVAINGSSAPFTHDEGKLTAIPDEPLIGGQTFVTVIHYGGVPRRIVHRDGTVEGWLRTRDGAVGIGEPIGTATWLPCNNSLSEKATFSFHITVPDDLKGVANGRLLRVTHQGARRTFDWSEAQPMNPYLAVIDIGQGKLVRGSIDGLPTWTMVDSRAAERWRPVLAALPGILRFESEAFGPYPFDTAGSIVDPAGFSNALESQTRPIYDLRPNPIVVVHEMAHQWFGDSVGLQHWPDIWLNEGFATWAQWYYEERHGGPSALQTFRQLRHASAFLTEIWDPPPGKPGKAKNLFATSVYLRGGMTLEALRIKIGTEKMLEVLRDWTAEHRYGNANTREFIDLAERVSERQLDPLFDRWLYEPGRPSR